MRKIWILALLLALAPAAALAQGFIVPDWPRHPGPHPPRPHPPFPTVRYQHVDVDIDGQAARTTVEQVFVNNYHQDLEGTYIFPLPQGAAISGFTMEVDGRVLRGEILGRDEARRIYEEIVRSRRDPALLEYFRDGLFRASVFPIPAHGEARVTIRYSEIVKRTGNACRYSVPLGAERLPFDRSADARVRIDIRSKTPIKSIYSPSHEIRVERDGDSGARVTCGDGDARRRGDFLLYYVLSGDTIGFELLSCEDDGQGYFLALVSPRFEVPRESVSRKDVIFILDTSGSMQGEKIEQARGALRFCLGGLQEDDRFNVIDFDDDARSFARGLVPAGRREISDALAFVERCDADGGTNIDGALREGLDQIEESRRPSFVIFLTDGLPTVGETSIDRILSNAKRANDAGTRIFVFGVGYDVNTRLLDLLAQESHASSDYVRPGEDIEAAVSEFFGKVSSPILTDVEISFDGIDAYDVYPREMPDIFKGSQLVVVGKCRGGERGRVTIAGSNRGERRTFSYDVRYAPDDAGTFVPRLWATRRIGYLVDQIRLHGEDRELVGEIVRLSKRYGIITEYTSFLVDTDYRVAVRDLVPQAERLLDESKVSFSGAAAVNRAKSSGTIAMAALAPRTFTDKDGAEREIANVVQAGARTFFGKNGLWVDSEYDGSMEPLKIRAFSEAYFALLGRAPEVGDYLALGENVIFLLHGTAVHVGSSGVEALSDADLKKLAGR